MRALFKLRVVCCALPKLVVKLHCILHAAKIVAVHRIASVGTINLLGLYCMAKLHYIMLFFVLFCDMQTLGVLVTTSTAVWVHKNARISHMTDHSSEVFPVLKHGLLESITDIRAVPKLRWRMRARYSVA